MNNWQNHYPLNTRKRNSFFSLDGNWNLNGQTIEVPFPPESTLSNYCSLKSETTFEYQKTFRMPRAFHRLNEDVILHFGAVDQICEVYFNNILIGKHEGGYLPFEFNVTSYLKNENSLKVIAIDTLDPFYPFGKQTKKPKGMWYTPVSGIWQSVWMESVPKNYIKNIKINASLTTLTIDIDSEASGFFVSFPYNRKDIYNQYFETKHIEITFKEKMHLWSTDDPYLYPLTIKTHNDQVDSYFGVREINIDENNQIRLNNKPFIIKAVLDQGYFKDGLFLPQKPLEYFNDVLKIKELGFNTIRKHIKIEPDEFYYACDKLGILVMQDMVNSGKYNFILDTALPTVGINIKRANAIKDKKRLAFFIDQSLQTQDLLCNHPSIIAYTVYNEGWGQQGSSKVYQTLKENDPSRLYDTGSGWFNCKDSDFESKHIYFRNKVLSPTMNKPLLLSECGGFQMAIEGHDDNHKSYGYGKVNSIEALTDKIEEMYQNMIIPSIKNGMSGYIITQFTDVEGEINGFYTYDREICKVDKKRIHELNKMI